MRGDSKPFEQFEMSEPFAYVHSSCKTLTVVTTGFTMFPYTPYNCTEAHQAGLIPLVSAHISEHISARISAHISARLLDYRWPIN